MPSQAQNEKILDFAADVRKFEIGLFWQRSLFFWGFTTTAIVAYGAAYQTHSQNLQFGVACIGFICGFIWTLVNRSSNYWQRVWENKVEAIQHDAIDYSLFRHRTSDAQQITQTWCWGPKHYSVSKLAIAFSDLTIFVWIGLILKSSPVWALLLRCPWIANDYTPAAIMFLFTASYIVAIFRYARPDAAANSN